MRTGTVTAITLLLGCCLTTVGGAAEAPIEANATSPWQKSVRGAVGYWGGDVTYQIGGTAWTSDTGPMELQDPLSELSFPLDVACVSLEGDFMWKGAVSIRLTGTTSLGDPATLMEDSDWNENGQLVIFSESEASLTAHALDVAVLFWPQVVTMPNGRVWMIGLGGGLLYQDLDWSAFNLDQWYPSNPELPHEREPGVAGTYESQMVMPYLGAGVRLRLTRLAFRAELGLGWASVEDEDDHVLRYKLAEGSLSGPGIKGSLEARYALTDKAFVALQASGLTVTADGTQKQHFYAGSDQGWRGEIDEEQTSTQVHASLALGSSF